MGRKNQLQVGKKITAQRRGNENATTSDQGDTREQLQAISAGIASDLREELRQATSTTLRNAQGAPGRSAPLTTP